jgi:hypothetical protein
MLSDWGCRLRVVEMNTYVNGIGQDGDGAGGHQRSGVALRLFAIAGRANREKHRFHRISGVRYGKVSTPSSTSALSRGIGIQPWRNLTNALTGWKGDNIVYSKVIAGTPIGA